MLVMVLQQVQQQQQQMQRQEERMQQQMEMLADRLSAGDATEGGGGQGGAGAGGYGDGGAAAATHSCKMVSPYLKSPEDTTLAVFRDWKERFTEYEAITNIDTECDRRANTEYYARPSTRTGAGCALRVYRRSTMPTTGDILST